MGLIYCSTDKAVERKEGIKEHTGIDQVQAEKLLDIQCKFKEVCVSVDDLAKEFQMLDQMAKDRAKMLEELGCKFDQLKDEDDALK